MAKFFQTPFASGGDRTAIPTAEQPDGSVSYTEGFGPDYELNPVINPNAKDVPRNETNELHYEEQLAIQQYQTHGVPDFISSADNGGSPYPYDAYAYVRYNAGSGFHIYQSLVSSNVALPTDTTKWQLVDGPAEASALIINSATFEGTVANNDAVYYDQGNTRFAKALADGSVKQNVVGFADVTNARVFITGIDSQFTGLTPNASYYLSTTVAGAITAVQPPSNLVHMGIALDATRFNVSITLAQAATAGVPAGSMIDFAGTTGSVPAGWLLCNGNAISRTTFAALFANIGTIWGVGDGSTTFNLPDFSRRAAIGSGGSGSGVIGNVVGNIGGAETHTQTIAEMATHGHSVNDPGHAHEPENSTGPGFLVQVGDASGSFANDQSGGSSHGTYTSTKPAVTDITVDDAGSGDAFNIMQPAAVVTKIIKY